MKREKAIKLMRACFADAWEFSKDPSTKVGCRIVGKKGLTIRSLGYNGMPRGCDDSNSSRIERPEKYWWFEHAERNAIYNAAREGISLGGSILIVTLFPCMDCARAVVQTGIEEVITMETKPDPKWSEHFDRSQALFEETKVKLTILSFEEVALGWREEAYARKIFGLPDRFE